MSYVGEIIESSLTRAVAQSKTLHVAPPFGGFVKIMDTESPIYGAVYNISTSSIEPNRQTVAYGIPYKDLLKEQPQIFSLLKTHFEIAIFAYKRGDTIHQTIPPHHPKIHSRVQECDDADLTMLTSEFGFFDTIITVAGNLAPELIAACIRTNAEFAPDKRTFLIRAGKELSRVYRDDYGTLQKIIRKLEM